MLWFFAFGHLTLLPEVLTSNEDVIDSTQRSNVFWKHDTEMESWQLQQVYLTLAGAWNTRTSLLRYQLQLWMQLIDWGGHAPCIPRSAAQRYGGVILAIGSKGNLSSHSPILASAVVFHDCPGERETQFQRTMFLARRVRKKPDGRWMVQNSKCNWRTSRVMRILQEATSEVKRCNRQSRNPVCMGHEQCEEGVAPCTENSKTL